MTTRNCILPECNQAVQARGLCQMHYDSERRAGRLEPLPPVPWTDRFWRYVDKTPECWLWTGSITTEGYGHLLVQRRTQYAHRLSYEIANGAIPEGLVIDHLCRNRKCVNPDHLEAVTHQENIARGTAPSAITAQTDRCFRGHDMSDAYLVRRNGIVTARRCRPCQRDSTRRSIENRALQSIPTQPVGSDR